jgi:hypothetical protein
MTIFDKLEEKATGMRGRGFRRPIIAEAATRETGNVLPYQLDSNREYELIAKVGVTFWANDAQYESARRIAEKHLAAVLYGDFLSLIDECAHAVSDGDEGDALAACCKMRDMILNR